MELITKAQTEQLLADGRAQRAAIDQDPGTRLRARRQALQYSSSGRAIRTSLHSPGTGDPEARLRGASRTPSVATSVWQCETFLRRSAKSYRLGSLHSGDHAAPQIWDTPKRLKTL